MDFSEKEDSMDDEKHNKNPKDHRYMPETYNECQDRFGIIFCDNLKVSIFNYFYYAIYKYIYHIFYFFI